MRTSVKLYYTLKWSIGCLLVAYYTAPDEFPWYRQIRLYFLYATIESFERYYAYIRTLIRRVMKKGSGIRQRPGILWTKWRLEANWPKAYCNHSCFGLTRPSLAFRQRQARTCRISCPWCGTSSRSDATRTSRRASWATCPFRRWWREETWKRKTLLSPAWQSAHALPLSVLLLIAGLALCQ